MKDNVVQVNLWDKNVGLLSWNDKRGCSVFQFDKDFYAIWMEYCTIGSAVGFCLCSKNFPYVWKQRKTLCRFA